jgi:hypothetical protein
MGANEHQSVNEPGGRGPFQRATPGAMTSPRRARYIQGTKKAGRKLAKLREGVQRQANTSTTGWEISVETIYAERNFVEGKI